MSAQHLKNRHGDDVDLETDELEQFATLLRGALPTTRQIISV